MPNISSIELLLILVVALLVIGPERLPAAIRTASLWLGRFRRSFYKVKAEIEREINADEVRRQLHNESVLADIRDTKSEVRKTAGEGARYGQQDRQPRKISIPAPRPRPKSKCAIAAAEREAAKDRCWGRREAIRVRIWQRRHRAIGSRGGRNRRNSRFRAAIRDSGASVAGGRACIRPQSPRPLEPLLAIPAHDLGRRRKRANADRPPGRIARPDHEIPDRRGGAVPGAVLFRQRHLHLCRRPDDLRAAGRLDHDRGRPDVTLFRAFQIDLLRVP